MEEKNRHPTEGKDFTTISFPHINPMYQCETCKRRYTGIRDVSDCVTKHWNEKSLEEQFKEVCSKLNTRGNPADPINPIYYNGRDVMDIINRYHLSFCLGQVAKYILRERGKGGLEDLKKAVWYLNEEIRIREESKNRKEES